MSSPSPEALRVSQQTTDLDFKIVDLAERLASISEARGCSARPYSKSTLSALSAMSLEKKENLLARLQATIAIVTAGTEKENDNPSNDYTEKRFVEMALDFYGYELKDEDFWKRVRKDELIEIYNAENIQIFRTFNFFATSSYSILDLLLNEWYCLWERPKGTFDHMYKVVHEIFSGEIKGIVPAGVPEHLINEIFNAEDQETFISRSSICKFGIICPIYNKANGQIGGFMVSAQVIPVAIGDQAKSISFI